MNETHTPSYDVPNVELVTGTLNAAIYEYEFYQHIFFKSTGINQQRYFTYWV